MTRPPQQAIMAKDIMPCDTETGQDTELSQSGYCDVDFVDPPPDSLQCPVCLSTLKQPHILSCCGSLMCEVNYLYNNIIPVCFTCITELHWMCSS